MTRHSHYPRLFHSGSVSGTEVTGRFDLSVVVPACNEEARLPSTLKALEEYLDDWAVSYQIIVVDDGSRDGTARVSDQFGPRITSLKLPENLGKGGAVRAGMLSATGRIIAFMDADLPYDLDSLKTSYDAIQSGQTDIILGARDIDGAGCLVKRRLARSLASTVFRGISRYLISREVTDTQAGFKCFSATAAKRVFSLTTINSFAFDTEVVFLIHRLKIPFQRVAVTLINERASTISLIRHALPMLGDMFRVRWNAWRGLYAETLILKEAVEPQTEETPLRAAA